MPPASTAIAALETGRDYVGYEISVEYLELANQRIADRSAG